jgi:hypothetical protein
LWAFHGQVSLFGVFTAYIQEVKHVVEQRVQGPTARIKGVAKFPDFLF